MHHNFSDGRHVSSSARDKTLDGLRAVAALGVVFAHAVAYRFAGSEFPGLNILNLLAGSLAQTSVQIFFVISGYIITTLLLREEQQRGRFSMSAFYIRRACRIFPPLAGLLLGLFLLDWLQFIDLDPASSLSAATFTCNIGIVDCQWWVAHTWSLAVEEQFYLVWPLVLLLVPKRTPLLVASIVILLSAFLVAPFTWHSNYISFTCIAAGALCASSSRLEKAVTARANSLAFAASIIALIIGPAVLPAKLMQISMPFIIVYIIFSARSIAGVRAMLAVKPVQLIGLASYSIYLWQQIFFATPELYIQPVPLWLFPIAVILSVVLIEKPFIRLGRRLSDAVQGPRRNPDLTMEAKEAV